MQNRPNLDIEFSGTEIQTLLKHFPKGIVAFDLEMTGLSPLFDKIIEIAAVKIDADGNVKSYHQLVNPLIEIPEKTVEYHGLRNDDLRDSPTLKKPLKEFIDFYGNLPLLAHNIQFDMGFILKGHHDFNYDLSLSDAYDSCRFARTLFKNTKEDKPENNKLSTLATFFDIKFNHHQALDDAAACMKVFINCLTIFEKHTAKRSLKEMAYIFKINSFKKATEYLLPKKLMPLKDCLLRTKEVQIVYKGGSTGANFRKILPIAFIPMPQGLVLYAECLETGMNKHFKVKKIKELKVD